MFKRALKESLVTYESSLDSIDREDLSFVDFSDYEEKISKKFKKPRKVLILNEEKGEVGWSTFFEKIVAPVFHNKNIGMDYIKVRLDLDLKFKSAKNYHNNKFLKQEKNKFIPSLLNKYKNHINENKNTNQHKFFDNKWKTPTPSKIMRNNNNIDIIVESPPVRRSIMTTRRNTMSGIYDNIVPMKLDDGAKSLKKRLTIMESNNNMFKKMYTKRSTASFKNRSSYENITSGAATRKNTEPNIQKSSVLTENKLKLNQDNFYSKKTTLTQGKLICE